MLASGNVQLAHTMVRLPTSLSVKYQAGKNDADGSQVLSLTGLGLDFNINVKWTDIVAGMETLITRGETLFEP